MIYGKIKVERLLELVSWVWHKNRCPVYFTPAAETLVESDARYELIVLRTAMETMLRIKVESWALVDSKDVYNVLTTQRSSIDRFVHRDVNCICFKFKAKLDVMGWIPGE